PPGRAPSAADRAPGGVLVSARKAGSTIPITVVTNQRGRYRFPDSRLPPGTYTLGIRAVGYDLERPATVTVAAHQPATVDLKVRKAADIAAQLSNAEWIASVPGTDQQKAVLRPCSHLHTLETSTRS